MTQDLGRAMKDGMRRLASGVSVLSAAGPDGKRYAMTVSSVTSVSDNPPSLLVCVNQNTRINPILTLGQRFAVNVLGQTHRDLSVVCSTGDQCESRFETGDWLSAPDKTPMLADAEAIFECEVDLVQAYGTHNIVVGRIFAVKVTGDGPDPLIYLDGSYRYIK